MRSEVENRHLIKHDLGKPMMDLIEPEFLKGVANILTYGANHYGDENWKNGSSEADKRRYRSALMRHLNAYRSGEKLDSDTGESHLYHIAVNAMFLDYFDRREDD